MLKLVKMLPEPPPSPPLAEVDNRSKISCQKSCFASVCPNTNFIYRYIVLDDSPEQVLDDFFFHPSW